MKTFPCQVIPFSKICGLFMAFDFILPANLNFLFSHYFTSTKTSVNGTNKFWFICTLNNLCYPLVTFVSVGWLFGPPRFDTFRSGGCFRGFLRWRDRRPQKRNQINSIWGDEDRNEEENQNGVNLLCVRLLRNTGTPKHPLLLPSKEKSISTHSSAVIQLMCINWFEEGRRTTKTTIRMESLAGWLTGDERSNDDETKWWGHSRLGGGERKQLMRRTPTTMRLDAAENVF